MEGAVMFALPKFVQDVKLQLETSLTNYKNNCFN